MFEKDYLTPQEVAKLLMVSPVTVRQWAQRGEIEAMTTPGGHRRFLRPAVESFAKIRGIPLSEHDDSEVLRVLVVDDDPVTNDYLVKLLHNQNEQVETESAYNGFEAGSKIETFKPKIVLLDLMMPGLDGFEVARFIKRDSIRTAIRILAMTSSATDENIERIMEAGAEACLSKPLDPEKLLSTVFTQQRNTIG